MIITAGKFKGLNVKAPDENITRPTLSKVRMSVFNTLQAMVEFEGSSFLDMFAGSGIMGLEAVSRGFEEVLAIEKHPKVFQILKNNAQNVLKGKCKFISIKNDSLKYLKTFDKKFDVIYIDPPYFAGIYEAALDAIKNCVGEIVILEHVTDVDFLDYELIKQKKYGDKFISFLRLKNN